jgi:16S rRNA (adenine1518-N6/adenine1519-N6)-dimethyltransferase
VSEQAGSAENAGGSAPISVEPSQGPHRSVAALLRAYGLRPRKQLGQNFLADPVALGRIVAAAELTAQDTVLEIGAGVGTLTRPLAEAAGHVVAVELDDGLVPILGQELADLSNVEIVHGDVLGIPSFGLAERGFKIVANLPYNITSAILRRFLEQEPRPQLMVVTVQREVADRIVAEPGQMSLLAVSVQLYGVPRIVARIPAGAFYPPPKVDSAVVRIDVRPEPDVDFGGELDDAAFFRVVRAGFEQKRKMLRNALAGGLRMEPGEVEAALAEAGVDARRRAQTLSLEEWGAVARALTFQEARKLPGR